MNSTQIKKPHRYIWGGLGGVVLGAVLLVWVEFLPVDNPANLYAWQMRLSFLAYVVLIISGWAILRGLSLAYHLRRYAEEERP
ncbi:hypothetical protein [Candidatus Leptofilum sp.]|uniref:hypothetical protein n=1 Tax=Candidatus Leptofilum sp. TaxID=3241576 RepID=UPI003B58C7D7